MFAWLLTLSSAASALGYSILLGFDSWFILANQILPSIKILETSDRVWEIDKIMVAETVHTFLLEHSRWAAERAGKC